MGVDKEKGYFRFLKSFFPFISVKCSKSVFISFDASSVAFAVAE